MLLYQIIQKIMHAVGLLQTAGYDSRIHIAFGTLFGYVFATKEETGKIAEALKSLEGITLSEKPVFLGKDD